MIKPSEDAPNNAILFSEIVHQVGLPKGVFNVVTGYGNEVGPELSGNEKSVWFPLPVASLPDKK